MDLSLHETAKALQVSPATVRNWVRSGVLVPTPSSERNSFCFPQSQVQRLIQDITEGRVDRLKKRKNKNHSSHRHTHPELLRTKKSKKNNLQLPAFLFDPQFETKLVLYSVYLALLQRRGLIQIHQDSITASDKILAELSEWRCKHDSAIFSMIQKLLDLFLPSQEKKNPFNDIEILGYVYQSRQKVGVKHRQGAYFTPPTVVDRLIHETMTKPGTFLDPCCGSGSFVVAAMLKLKQLKASHFANKVFGIDIDPLAVLICRASLTLASMGRANSLEQISLADSLTTNPFNQKFDYIVTNPPWGASLPPTIDSHFQHAHSESRNQRQSFDSFGYFLFKLPVYLLPKGRFSFVLPAAFATVKRHRELRHFLMAHFTDVQLQKIPEKFSGVLTSSVSVRGCLTNKTSTQVDCRNAISPKNRTQKDSMKDSETALPIGLSRRDLKVIEMMEKHPLRLKNQSKFALGIVTGNNQKYLQDEPLPNHREIIRGRDIQPFQILPKKQIYICLDSGLQQVAPLNCYLANPKLVYRFISDRFIFAIDRQQRLTLNSANVLIPFMEGYSLEALCGIFNSDLARFYFQKKYSSLKVLKQHLENFPLPSCTGKSQLIKKVASLAEQLESKPTNREEIVLQLNELVSRLYNIAFVTKF